MLVKDGIGMGVQVVLNQHDFLGLRVSRGQDPHEAVVVGARAAGRNLDQALAGTWFEGDQQTGGVLAHMRAAPPVRA